MGDLAHHEAGPRQQVALDLREQVILKLVAFEILRERGVTDFADYAATPGNEDLWADFYVDGYGEGAIPAWAPDMTASKKS